MKIYFDVRCVLSRPCRRYFEMLHLDFSLLSQDWGQKKETRRVGQASLWVTTPSCNAHLPPRV